MADANIVKFFTGTEAQYTALGTKDPNTLYVITDTGKIFKGADDVTSDITMIPTGGTVPTALASGKMAIKTSVYTVGDPAADHFVFDLYAADPSGNVVKVQHGVINGDFPAWTAGVDIYDDYVPTVKAVKQALASTGQNPIVDAAYDDGTGELNFTRVNDTKDVELTNMAHDVIWNTTDMKLTIPMWGQPDLEILLPKEQFLKNAYYQADYPFPEGDAPALVFEVAVIDAQGQETIQKIAIPAANLVNDYTVADTDSINLELDEDHEITAKIIVASDTPAATDKLLTYKLNENNPVVVDSQKTIGGDAFSTVEATQKTTVATEFGVIEKIDDMIGDAVSATEAATEKNVMIANGTNKTIESGVKIGGAALDVATVSATKLATEKAVIDALTWQTL